MPSILKGMSEVYSMEIYCEICECNIRKSGWAKHVKTKKHVDGIVQREKKQCWKCRCFKVLEGFTGENATCDVCLAQWKRWANKNSEKRKEAWQKYWAENREEINAKKKEYNQIEVDCDVCECKVRKNKWSRHVRSNKHMVGVEKGGSDGNLGDGSGGGMVG